MIDYVYQGLGVNYDLHSFFIYTIIDGCTLTCNYGDTCGATK